MELNKDFMNMTVNANVSQVNGVDVTGSRPFEYKEYNKKEKRLQFIRISGARHYWIETSCGLNIYVGCDQNV